MASIAASKWSMSVHSDDRLTLKLKLHARRWFYILSLPVIVLYCLILCGCVSKAPLTSNIFIVELHDTRSHDLTIVRIGFFGICARTNITTFSCSPSMLSPLKDLPTLLSASPSLIKYAVEIQRSVSYATISTSGVLFLAGLITLAALQIILRRQKPSWASKENNNLEKHITNLTIATCLMLWVSAAVSLAATYSTYCSLSALQVATSPEHGAVIGGKVSRGTIQEAMQWAVFATSVLFCSCVHVAAGPPRSNYTSRKSKLGPSTPDIRKMTIPSTQRLELTGAQNHSQQSITDQNPIQSLSRSGSVNRLLQREQFPPLATLQRRPTLKSTSEEGRALTPLLPDSIVDGQTLSWARSQRSVRKGSPEDKPLLSPIMPLQGILKVSSPPSTPGLYPPPANSRRPGQKNFWV